MLATRWIARDHKGRWGPQVDERERSEVATDIEAVFESYYGAPDTYATRCSIVLRIRELIFGDAG